MALKLMGKKCGMTQRFDKTGKLIVCTVIHAEPNVITQIKTKENDGYTALQVAYDKIVVQDSRTMPKRMSKQLLGHFKKSSVEPRRYLEETRIDNVDQFSVGQELSVAIFQEGVYVDVAGISKGKGFQGVIKRYGFKGGPAAHGSGFHRHGGSTGMRSTPGRCLPGTKKAGRMGGERVTVENLRVVGVDSEKNLILIEGAIPGPQGSVVTVAPAIKMKNR